MSEAAENRGETVDIAASDLAARVEFLADENERLRREYQRSQRLNVRNTALGLMAVGAIAAGGGVLFPGTRDLLFALAGTGLFSAVLVYFLRPTHFLATGVSEGVYAAHARTGRALIESLGLDDTLVYVPGVPSEFGPGVRLFVPQHRSYDVPSPESLRQAFVVTEEEQRRGLSLSPTGAELTREFSDEVDRRHADSLADLAPRLSDALVEVFEIAAEASSEVQPTEDRLDVRVRDCEFGSVDRFDHPVVSFVAVTTADVVDAPVEVETNALDEADDEYLVSCSVSPDHRSP